MRFEILVVMALAGIGWLLYHIDERLKEIAVLLESQAPSSPSASQVL